MRQSVSGRHDGRVGQRRQGANCVGNEARPGAHVAAAARAVHQVRHQSGVLAHHGASGRFAHAAGHLFAQHAGRLRQVADVLGAGARHRGPAAGRSEAPDAAAAEEGGVAGHVHVAEEVRPPDVVGDDGAGGRAAEAPLLGVGQHGGDIENCRNEDDHVANESRPGAGSTGAIAAL